jgi:periplasmic copper chaperone A
MGTCTRIAVFLVLIFTLAACTNQSSPSQGLSIEGAWARPGLTGGNSAIYLLINNPTSQEDTLISAGSDVAEFVELHMTSMDADGNMRMQQQESILVAANSQVEFKPGGLHIMLIQLQQDLTADQVIPVTLRFENAGSIQIQATVKQP